METKVGIGKHAHMVMKSAGVAPSSAPAALWQMLLAAAPDIISSSVAQRGGASFAAVGEITGVRNLDVLDLLRRRKILMNTMQPQTVVVEPAFEERLRHFVTCLPPGPVQDRFIRWEIIKMGMCYGVLNNGCFTDTSEGREIRIPLKFTQIPTTPASTQTRADALNHPQVQSELFKAWNEVTLRGGVTLSSYYGLSKVLYQALFPHLSPREIHQLISTEVDIDLPEQTDDSQPMTKPQFMRWLASIALMWLESHCVAEALTFAQHLVVLLQQPIERIDLDFVNTYGRKDPSLLIPLVPARVVNGGVDAVLFYAREQYILTARVRFGSLLSDAPIVAKARVKKRQRHAAGKSIGVYMAPAMEQSMAPQGDEEAVDPDRFVNSDSKDRTQEEEDDDAAFGQLNGSRKAEPRLHESLQLSPPRRHVSSALRDITVTTHLEGVDDGAEELPAAVTSTSTVNEPAVRRRSPLALLRRCRDDLQGNYFSNRFGLSSRGRQERSDTRPVETPVVDFDPRRAIPPLDNKFVMLPALKAATPQPKRTTGVVAHSGGVRLKTFKAPDSSAVALLRKLRGTYDEAERSLCLRPDSESPWFKRGAL